MSRRVVTTRWIVVVLLGVLLLGGVSGEGIAVGEPAPRAVLFRLHSPQTITEVGDSLEVGDPLLRAICDTRGVRRPALVYEGLTAEKTLYQLVLGSSDEVAGVLADLRALASVEDAQPDHFLVMDQANFYTPPTDLYYARDYNPFPPFTGQDSLNSVYPCIQPHNWAQCAQLGWGPNPLTFHAEDFHLTDQWPLQMTQTDLAWYVCDGDRSVKVGVLDSGVDWRHPDLGENIWQNLAQDANGNGFVIYQKSGGQCPNPPYCEWEFDQADLTSPDQWGGYDNNLIGRRFHSNLWLPGQPTLGRHDPDHGHCAIGAGSYGSWPIGGGILVDTNGYQLPHGTQMASIIGAVHNGFGCAGMCAEVSIVPMNAGASFEFQSDPQHAEEDSLREHLHIIGESEMVSAIPWAIENGVDILNISLSCGEWGEPLFLKDKIIDAYNAGMIICCSAGNKSNDAVRWPASWPEVLTCAVVNNLKDKTYYSSYGSNVDFAAPSGERWDRAPGFDGTAYMTAAKFTPPEPFWPDLLPPYAHPLGGQADSSGPVHTYKDTRGDTSGGAAQLSGAFALLKAHYPNHTREGLIAEMVRGAVDVDPYQTDPEVVGKLGHGQINPYRSLTEWGGPRASELPSVVWSDSVWVSGDYTVPAGASLTILPGTTVYVANFDNERDGDYSDFIEISGAAVNAIGTPESPIRFVSYGPEAISSRNLIFGKEGASELGAVKLEHCEFIDLELLVFGSTNVQADTTMVSNCTFVDPGGSSVQYLLLGDAYLRSCTFEPGWTVLPYNNAHIEWCKFEHVATEASPTPPIVLASTSGRVFMANSIVRDAEVAIRTYAGPTDTLYLDGVLVEHVYDPPEVARGELGIDVQGGVVQATGLTLRGYSIGVSLDGSGRFSAEYSTFTSCYYAALNLNTSDNLMFFGYYVEPGSPLNKGGHNVFVSNQKYNIFNRHPTGTVSARWNWWGSPSGPPPKSNAGRVDALFPLQADPQLPPPPDFMVLLEEPSPPFAVGRNFPNPFNPVTEFKLTVPRGGGLVRATVYDIRGRTVRRLLDKPLASGEHRIEFNGRNDEGEALPSGMYLCRFNFRDREEVVKATLVK